MYPVICKVHGLSSYDNEEINDYVIIFADNLKDAGEQLDKYYGQDIDRVVFEFLESGPLQINREIAERILMGEFY